MRLRLQLQLLFAALVLRADPRRDRCVDAFYDAAVLERDGLQLSLVSCAFNRRTLHGWQLVVRHTATLLARAHHF